MISSATSGWSWLICFDHRSGQSSHSGFWSSVWPIYRYGVPRTRLQPTTVWSRNANPGVGGRKCIQVQPIESPNTETVNGRLGSRGLAGWSAPGGPGGEGEIAATDDTPGGSPSRSPGPVPTGTTSNVTAAALATVAAANGNNGTRDGRQRRIGCSISHHDAAATATVTAHRAANSVAPDHPVRSPLSARKIGQCHR